MRVCLIIVLFSLLFGFSCRSAEQAFPSPAPAENKAEATPDVIKIAIWFMRFEGIETEVTVGSGRVVGQDRDAYYVGFQRKVPRPHRVREVLVKVYKRNGLAEWEEY